MFRGVELRPGTHRVVFTYEPTAFRVGAGISLVTLLLFVGLCARAWRSHAASGK